MTSSFIFAGFYVRFAVEFNAESSVRTIFEGRKSTAALLTPQLVTHPDTYK